MSKKYLLEIHDGETDWEWDGEEERRVETPNTTFRFSSIGAALDYLLDNNLDIGDNTLTITEEGQTEPIFEFCAEVKRHCTVTFDLTEEEAELKNIATKFMHGGKLIVSVVTTNTDYNAPTQLDLTAHAGKNTEERYMAVLERNLKAEVNNLKKKLGLPYEESSWSHIADISAKITET